MSVLVDGNPDSPLLIVGMAPGKTELAEGAPFVGSSGALLWNALSGTGLSRADCFIINCIGEIQTGTSPSPAQLAKYWDEVEAALASSKAKAILALGGDALRRLLNSSYKITGWRGYIIPAQDFPPMRARPVLSGTVFKSGPRKGLPNDKVSWKAEKASWPKGAMVLIPTLHPSAVIRDRFRTTPAFFWDVQRAARLAQGRQEAPKDPPTDAYVCFDIENSITTGRFGAIHRLGIQAGRGPIYSVRWDDTARTLASPLCTPSFLKVGFNLAHDVTHLHNAGVSVQGPYYDVMLACQLLQPDLQKSLNYCASLYLDTERWKHLSDSNPILYNRLDVQKTVDLWAEIDPLLDETGQRAVFNTEMEALPHLISLREQGVNVDRAARGRIEEVLRYQASGHLRTFQGFYPGVNPRSSAQMIKALKLKGYNVPKAEGKETADEAALRSIWESNPTDFGLKALLNYREVSKSLDYLLVPLWEDGRVHPNYLPASKDDRDEESGKGIAGTGRIQARDPNIQQVPKLVREIYVPDTLDHVFVEADYQQAELRVSAAISNDRALAERLNGPDLHGVHASRWNCSRDEAKTLVYAISYGAGVRKLQRTFARKDGERLVAAFYADYPDFKAYRDRLVHDLSTTRQLRNPFGRIRYFWHPAKDTPAGLDFIPQSTVADIVWSTVPAVNALAMDLGGRLTAIVHDSYLIQVEKRHLTTAKTALKEVLERRFDNIAPGFYLPVTTKSGPNWRHLE